MEQYFFYPRDLFYIKDRYRYFFIICDINRAIDRRYKSLMNTTL